MHRFFSTVVLGSAMALGVWAEGAAVPPSDSTKISDLTVGDLKALAAERSIDIQKAGYVRRAEISSFLMPGLGQFEVGDPLGGALNLAGQIALVGGTFYASWALLPSEARDASGSDRRSAIAHSWSSDPGRMAASTGVLVGGLTLSVFQRFWAADDAAHKAKSNIASGKVTFEPEIGFGFLGLRAGF